MKIVILGLSGAGKSTLARELGQQHGVQVLHLDRVHFLPGWVERDLTEEQEIVGAFLDENSDWVIDGSYSGLHHERRLEEADLIYILLAPRLVRLWRVLGRWWRFRGVSRPDMGSGNLEKVDLAFVKWILWEGCKPARMRRYRQIAQEHPTKTRIYRWWRGAPRAVHG